MGLLELTSGNSLWRGYDYYKDKKVKMLSQNDDGAYAAFVNGSNNNVYSVQIDTLHPRKSRCNCPHADGKRIICKHMMAVYFTAFPKEAERIYNEALEYEREREMLQEQLFDEIPKRVHKMSKAQLEEILLQVLYDGPEWQFERFVREYIE